MLAMIAIVAIYTTTTYLYHLLFLNAWMVVFSLLSWVDRANHGDELNIGLYLSHRIFYMVMLTSWQYIYWTDRAELFQKIKHSEQQNEQLTDLLDTVPDSVLICSKPQDKPKEIEEWVKMPERIAQYQNLQMKLFYGQDLVQLHAHQIEEQKKAKQAHTIRDPISLEQAFAQRTSADLALASNDRLDGGLELNLTLEDIIQEYEREKLEQKA